MVTTTKTTWTYRYAAQVFVGRPAIVQKDLNEFLTSRKFWQKPEGTMSTELATSGPGADGMIAVTLLYLDTINGTLPGEL